MLVRKNTSQIIRGDSNLTPFFAICFKGKFTSLDFIVKEIHKSHIDLDEIFRLDQTCT